MLKGLDCYAKSNPLNFNQVKQDGFSFVICKATEGTTFHDAKFSANYRAAYAAGLIVGAYSFSRPKGNTAEQEAKTLVQAVEAAGGFCLPPILDMEDDGGLSDADLGQYIKAWKAEIQKHDNRKPIIYLNRDFYNRLKSYLDGFILWIAQPGADKPSIDEWSFWQSSWEGKEQGGTFDFDFFNGDLPALQALAKQITVQAVKPATVVAKQTPQKPTYQDDNAHHTILNGETLTGIAAKYHVPMNILAKYNLIDNPNVIKAGDILRIPVAVEVRSGDTVTELARRRNEKPNVIGYVNGLENINLIYVGQTLWV